MIVHTDGQTQTPPATGFTPGEAGIRKLKSGIDWFPEEAGGLERCHHGLLKHFPGTGVQARGHVSSSTAVTRGSLGKGPSVCPITGRLRARLLAFGKGAIRACGEFRRHAVGGYSALYTWPGLVRSKDLPLVQHLHDLWYAEAKLEGAGRSTSFAPYRLQRTVYRRAAKLITLLEVFKIILLTEFGISESRVKVIPGGVDCRRSNSRQFRFTRFSGSAVTCAVRDV